MKAWVKLSPQHSANENWPIQMYFLERKFFLCVLIQIYFKVQLTTIHIGSGNGLAPYRDLTVALTNASQMHVYKI